MTCEYLNHQDAKRKEFEKMASDVPTVERGVALSVISGVIEFTIWASDEVPDVSPGLRLWAADRIDELEGTSIDQEELDIIPGPSPISR
jgi:hypothetical protein